MSDAQRKALDAYRKLSSINGQSHVYRAATQLGVFRSLSSGQKEAPQIAADCGADQEVMELILQILCAMQVVERYGDDYALAPVMHLLTDHDRNQGDHYWSVLADVARAGRPTDEVEELDGRYRAAVSSLQWMNTPAALTVARALEVGTTRQGLRILDIGSSTAVWSLTLLHHDANATATLIDVPDVLATALRMASEIGVADRITALEGDYRQLELPTGFNLVLVSGLLQLEDDEGCLHLLRRARASLEAEGELVVVDVFEGQEGAELDYALFALSLRLRTQRGRLRSAAELGKLIEEAGFEAPTYAHLPDPPAIRGILVAKTATG